MATVDIVIPNYQYGRYLRDCVSSVLLQGINDVRVLIIDNASTDNSVEIARQLAKEDHRIEVAVHAENVGLHASFAEAIEWAQAKYFFWLCADDYIAPGALASAVDFMERHPDVNMTFGEVVIFQNDDLSFGGIKQQGPIDWQVLTGRQFLELSFRSPMQFNCSASHALVRACAQKRAGGYRPDVRFAMDVNMMLRIASFGNIAQTISPFGYRRNHSTNVSNVYTDDFAMRLAMAHEAYASFFDHEGCSIPDREKLFRLEKRSIAARAWWAAASHLVRGQPKAATNLFKFAFKLSPRTSILPPVDYLLEMDRPLNRVFEVAVEAIGKMRKSASF